MLLRSLSTFDIGAFNVAVIVIVVDDIEKTELVVDDVGITELVVVDDVGMTKLVAVGMNELVAVDDVGMIELVVVSSEDVLGVEESRVTLKTKNRDLATRDAREKSLLQEKQITGF